MTDVRHARAGDHGIGRVILVRATRWAATLVASAALVVGAAGTASAGDWEQDGYSGWTPPSWGWSSPVPAPSGGVRVFEDDPSGQWSCASQGNRVCGPGVGPNTTDHNVYYGTGALPYIPGRVTTREDGTSDGPVCIPSVFVELGHAVPAGAVSGDCS